jgi:hypothetical protein
MPLSRLLTQVLPVPLSRRAYAPRCMAPTCCARRSPCSSHLRRIACVERLRSANTRNPSLHHRGCGHLSGVTGSSGRSRASAGFLCSHFIPAPARKAPSSAHSRFLSHRPSRALSNRASLAGPAPHLCVCIALDSAHGAEQDSSRPPLHVITLPPLAYLW